MRISKNRALPILFLSVLMEPVAACASAPPPSVVKVFVEHDAVYRITWEDLRDAGLGRNEIDSARIGLEQRGRAVPIWVDDGGDGRFGPGDRLEFLGERLRGPEGGLDPYTRWNVYRLGFEHAHPLHGAVAPDAGVGRDGQRRDLLRARLELQEDRLLVRFRERPGVETERWYWARMAVTDAEPFALPIELPGLVRDSADAVHLRFGLRGWSRPLGRAVAGMPHHRVDLVIDGAPVATGEWDGQDPFVLEADLAASGLAADAMTVALRVPLRRAAESDDILVDVVLLNWIEIDYPGQPTPGVPRRFLAPGVPGEAARGTWHAHGGGLTTWGTGPGEDAGGPRELWIGSGDAARPPAAIVADEPSRLRAPDHRIDYIMVTHRTLRDPLERLAQLHRSRGLAVEIVDIEDVYDEFNHSVPHPRALRDFLGYAWHEWQTPRPRFVLLAGDASWDPKSDAGDDSRYADWTFRPGERGSFIKNRSTPYGELRDRNLVPTWSYPTYEGHAASDNWLACVDGDDDIPEMAIGRIPVVEPAELEAVIAKIEAAVLEPEIGPWRREVLFITNEDRAFQRRSDIGAEELTRRGYHVNRIYPDPAEAANERHTRSIVERLDSGVQLVQFLGHGGRYIWRTGPPDLKKNHDLFTLAHLDDLRPTRRLPVVVSLTCYSAPFDHPTADSIGEKLLRLPGRGAIAVYAASWRNSPSAAMGRALMDELTVPGTTIGEAIRRAKQAAPRPILAQTYNLLGDPAVPVAAPAARLVVDAAGAGGAVTVRAEDGALRGRLLVEWVDQGMDTVATRETEVTADEASLAAANVGAARLRGVRAYAWDVATGWDAVGWLDLTEPSARTPGAVVDDARAAGEGR